MLLVAACRNDAKHNMTRLLHFSNVLHLLWSCHESLKLFHVPDAAVVLDNVRPRLAIYLFAVEYGSFLDIHGILVPSIAYCSRLVYNEFNFDYFILSTISSGNTIASFSCCCLSSLCSRPSTELTWGCTKCLHFRLSRISSIQWPNTHCTRLHGQMPGASGV